MPFNRIAENKIREAMAAGQFENLPGAGEPLDLEEYFSTPEDFRMAYAVLKNAKCAPVEVELLKEIARLKTELAATADVSTQQLLRQRLTDRQTELAVMLERRAARP